MMTKLKYLYALVFALSFNIFIYADDIDDENNNDTPTMPVPGVGGWVGGGGTDIGQPGTGGEFEGTRYNPIDMHASALLVAGVGLIASYAYFARRRKEHI